MDAHRFDQFLRAFTTVRSRRDHARALLGFALGSAAGATLTNEVAAGRGCKTPCGECGFCKRGRCRKKNGKKRCEPGKCLEIPDGTPCSIGSCLVGQCAPPVAL